MAQDASSGMPEVLDLPAFVLRYSTLGPYLSSGCAHLLGSYDQPCCHFISCPGLQPEARPPGCTVPATHQGDSSRECEKAREVTSSSEDLEARGDLSTYLTTFVGGPGWKAGEGLAEREPAAG